MFHRLLRAAWPLLLIALLGSVGCTQPIEESAAPDTLPTAVVTETPEAVAEAFYAWYLDAIGDRADGAFTNLLAEGSYRESPYLSADFIAQIDATLASFTDSGYDPILQAQDVPERITFDPASIDGDSATVVALRYWGGKPDPSPMTVHLRQSDGVWRIDNVTAFEIPQTAAPAVDETPLDEPVLEEPETADTVVRAFYDWYLGYVGDPATETFRNPLVDQAYHNTPYLSDDFVGYVDALLADMRTELEGGGYDPFLCAQAIPEAVTPTVTFEGDGVASVVVTTTFANHLFTVDLRQTDNTWRIVNITCASSPAGSVKTFYTWYLGTIGNRADGTFTNPLVEGLYRDHPLLTDAFIADVDATLAGFEQGGYDPFLLAQDIPTAFSVDPGVTAGTAVVHLHFWGDSVKHLLVTTEQQGARWPIVAIVEDTGLPSAAPVGDSAADTRWFRSDMYGFAFQYAADWSVVPLPLDVPGQPDDWPVVAAWTVQPGDFVAPSGPPDPTAPVMVAPFNVEVVVGDTTALARVYGDLDGRTVVHNSYEAIALSRDPGYQHVIFPHPNAVDTWIVFTDWVTAFPDREAQAAAAGPWWSRMLDSVRFEM